MPSTGEGKDVCRKKFWTGMQILQHSKQVCRKGCGRFSEMSTFWSRLNITSVFCNQVIAGFLPRDAHVTRTHSAVYARHVRHTPLLYRIERTIIIHSFTKGLIFYLSLSTVVASTFIYSTSACTVRLRQLSYFSTKFMTSWKCQS